MGISKRICSENRVEIRKIKKDMKRILKWNEEYPGQLSPQRRMDLTVKLNEMAERAEYLGRDKHANLREHPDKNFDFKYIFKKQRVKNRKLAKQ